MNLAQQAGDLKLSEGLCRTVDTLDRHEVAVEEVRFLRAFPLVPRARHGLARTDYGGANEFENVPDPVGGEKRLLGDFDMAFTDELRAPRGDATPAHRATKRDRLSNGAKRSHPISSDHPRIRNNRGDEPGRAMARSGTRVSRARAHRPQTSIGADGPDSARCSSATTAAPSPTAAPTRFTEPARTSPTANTPGLFVSCGRARVVLPP